MKKRPLLIIGAVAIAAAAVIYFASRPVISRQGPAREAAGGASGPAEIRIVAAENFYGNIAAQLGGDKVSVKSIISNPNIDPHEYESSVEDGIAITKARIIIKNGLEYDTWMDKMISASPNPGRTVITAGKIAPRPLPGNPHVWYGADNVEAVANAITAALVKADPPDKALFEKNLSRFNASLAPIRAKINGIRSKYAGTPAGLTETIGLYLTRPMGLKVLTPFDFQKAIAEGNDPPAAGVAAANSQVDNKEIKILIYNSQTVTPITTHMRNAARARGIPLVPVSETMPPGDTYQSWMLAQLNAIANGLATATGATGR
ncbi:MAG: zinc ABC transporter substrate-binding protein [Nitrospiraceae bacterium]|nr:zinc ABC transporter substrate-binding protein [Nitrospiraceae bacterium]